MPSTPAGLADQPGACLDQHQSVVLICERCHREVGEAFRQSLHFRKASTGERTPTCIDCHSAAGGSVLAGEAVPQRCGACHNASGVANQAVWVTEKAPELLHLLRTVTLARTMDQERLDSARRLGEDTTALEADMKRVDATFRDIPFEWHRFNLRDVEKRSRDALEILESLNDQLELRAGRPQPQPVVAEVTPSAGAQDGRPLRFAVASIVNPVATYEGYRGLFDELGRALGRPYEFVQRRTYDEMNDLLLQGEVDLAFICSGGYVALPSDAPIEIVALPVVNGQTVYHSLIIVRKNSPVQQFNDLAGSRFAFTDPLSATGHLYPLFRVAALGKNSREFFGSTLFSGSHDQSILAVSHGLVDAAAVNELVYNRLVGPHSVYSDQLRVIESSADFGIPPVVAPLSVAPELRARMRDFLLHLGETAQGRERLAALGFDGFTLGNREIYRSIRKMGEVTGAKPH